MMPYQSQTELRTLLDWIRFCASEMARPDIVETMSFGQGCDNAFDEAHALVLGLLHLPYDMNPAYFHAQLTAAERDKIASALTMRIVEKVPVAYLTNRTLFMGLSFYVDERVLIPRSPIAELIENRFSPYIELSGSESINEANEETADAGLKVLDLCCGSGCIGIACAYAFDDAEVVLSDYSDDALAVAERNVEQHQLDHRVRLHQADLFDGLSGERFDVIVTNPPYVDQETMAYLPDEFRHEPAFALASGEDGLDLTRRILQTAADYLTPNGILVLEVGASWPLLEAAFPDVMFSWHPFENGGEGVLIMSADELKAYQSYFAGND